MMFCVWLSRARDAELFHSQCYTNTTSTHFTENDQSRQSCLLDSLELKPSGFSAMLYICDTSLLDISEWLPQSSGLHTPQRCNIWPVNTHQIQTGETRTSRNILNHLRQKHCLCKHFRPFWNMWKQMWHSQYCYITAGCSSSDHTWTDLEVWPVVQQTHSFNKKSSDIVWSYSFIFQQ